MDATTSWLPAGPTTPSSFEFEANDFATLTANAVSIPSWVSPGTTLICLFLFAFCAFQRLT